VYVGCTANYWQRINRHINDMKVGVHYKRVQYAYDLFGPPKYEVIGWVPTGENGYDMEKQCIAEAGARSLNFKNANQYEQYYTDKKNYIICDRYDDYWVNN
jgi:hypothetical protein